ncbi:MAG: nuclear transport factor 2 family protein [Phycisphaerales bacterium]
MRLRAVLACLVAAAWVITLSPAVDAQDKTVILVRHAEKATDSTNPADPPLTDEGRDRAAALARLLANAEIDAIISSEYRRTRDTVAPLARAMNLEAEIISARDLEATIDRATTGEETTVLVCGHSNTVPAMLGALGVERSISIADDEYDRLFVVFLDAEEEDGRLVARLLEFRFGADPAGNRRGPNAQQPIGVGVAFDDAIAIHTVLDSFHDAAAKADEDRYFGHMTEDAVFLGTDATERWTRDEFEAFALPYFERDTAWTYHPRDRHIGISPGGDAAWFDELLDHESYGECRGSGALVRDEASGEWKIAHYHLTIPIPNDLAREFVDRIRKHDAESSGDP